MNKLPLFLFSVFLSVACVTSSPTRTQYAFPGTLTAWTALANLNADFRAQVRFFLPNAGAYFLVTKNDSVYALGASHYHKYPLLALGLDTRDVATPTEIVELRSQGIIQIYGCYMHMLALSKTGAVWVWGANDYGQLGQGHRNATNFRPLKLTLLPQGISVVSVACGNGQSYALTSAGEIYAWGDDTNGQLGIGKQPKLHQESPVRSTQTLVVDLRCYSNWVEVMALNSEGKVFMWGIGIGRLPKELDVNKGKSVKSLAVTATHGYVLTEEGEIYVRRNTSTSKDPFAELFYGGEHKLVTIEADIFIGRQFLVGRTAEGKVLIWRDELAGGHAFEESPLGLMADAFAQQEGVPAYVNFMIDVTGDVSDTTELPLTFAPTPPTTPRSLATTSPTVTATPRTIPTSPTDVTLTTPSTTTVNAVVVSPTPAPGSSCEHANRILTDIFNNSAVADFHFRLKDGSPLYALRHILIITSETMKVKLADGGVWQASAEVAIDEYNTATYSRYIKYLYTDQLDAALDMDAALDLFALASELREETLKQRCHDIIHKS